MSELDDLTGAIATAVAVHAGLTCLTYDPDDIYIHRDGKAIVRLVVRPEAPDPHVIVCGIDDGDKDTFAQRWKAACLVWNAASEATRLDFRRSRIPDTDLLVFAAALHFKPAPSPSALRN